MRHLKIPEEYASRFQSEGVRICVMVPRKLQEALRARASQQSTADGLVSMGEAARELLMQAICHEEGTDS